MPEYYVVKEEKMVCTKMVLVRAESEQAAHKGKGVELVELGTKLVSSGSSRIVDVLPFEEPK